MVSAEEVALRSTLAPTAAPGIVEGHDGGVVVDVDRLGRGRRLVAGDVGDDDLQVGGAVGEARRSQRLLYVEPTVGAVCVPKTVNAPAPHGLISKRTAETPEAGGVGAVGRAGGHGDAAGDERGGGG